MEKWTMIPRSERICDIEGCTHSKYNPRGDHKYKMTYHNNSTKTYYCVDHVLSIFCDNDITEFQMRICETDFPTPDKAYTGWFCRYECIKCKDHWELINHTQELPPVYECTKCMLKYLNRTPISLITACKAFIMKPTFDFVY